MSKFEQLLSSEALKLVLLPPPLVVPVLVELPETQFPKISVDVQPSLEEEVVVLDEVESELELELEAAAYSRQFPKMSELMHSSTSSSSSYATGSVQFPKISY